jgi:hypothetical protein
MERPIMSIKYIPKDKIKRDCENFREGRIEGVCMFSKGCSRALYGDMYGNDFFCGIACLGVINFTNANSIAKSQGTSIINENKTTVKIKRKIIIDDEL